MARAILSRENEPRLDCSEPMKRWRIEYRDDADDGCPVFTTHVRGYTREHAIERFHDAPDGDGWEILKVTQA